MGSKMIDLRPHYRWFDEDHSRDINRDIANLHRGYSAEDIAERWDMDPEGISEIRAKEQEYCTLIETLAEKIKNMDKLFGVANDLMDGILTETKALLEFTDPFEIDGDNSDDVLHWCSGNLKGNWNYLETKNLSINKLSKNPSDKIFIYIKDDQDRIHFKLRWS